MKTNKNLPTQYCCEIVIKMLLKKCYIWKKKKKKYQFQIFAEIRYVLQSPTNISPTNMFLDYKHVFGRLDIY